MRTSLTLSLLAKLRSFHFSSYSTYIHSLPVCINAFDIKNQQCFSCLAANSLSSSACKSPRFQHEIPSFWHYNRLNQHLVDILNVLPTSLCRSTHSTISAKEDRLQWVLKQNSSFFSSLTYIKLAHNRHHQFIYTFIIYVVLYYTFLLQPQSYFNTCVFSSSNAHFVFCQTVFFAFTFLVFYENMLTHDIIITLNKVCIYLL